jgi:hypothetical protein
MAAPGSDRVFGVRAYSQFAVQKVGRGDYLTFYP